MTKDTTSRRAWMKTSALGLASLAMGQADSFAETEWNSLEASTRSSSGAFIHRGYLGWITDLATQPDPTAAWPSMRLDEGLLRDYRKTFEVMSRLRMNEIVVWGF